MDWRQVLKEHLDSRNQNRIIFKMSHVFPSGKKEATKEHISNRRKLAMFVRLSLAAEDMIKIDEYTISVYSRTAPYKYLAIRCG